MALKRVQKKIKIACSAADEIDIEEFKPLQGSLKTLDPEDKKRLMRSIIKLGFSFPFCAWKDPKGQIWIIDAHQRYDVLMTLKADGWIVPPLPVAWIEAKDMMEAKKKLLAAASQYGKVNARGLYDFLRETKVNIDDAMEQLRFPEVDLSTIKVEFFNNPDKEPKEKELDENIKTDHKCPSCGYQW